MIRFAREYDSAVLEPSTMPVNQFELNEARDKVDNKFIEIGRAHV